jgi:hypothetical protein
MKTSELLGISRKTLREKTKKLKVEVGTAPDRGLSSRTLATDSLWPGV